MKLNILGMTNTFYVTDAYEGMNCAFKVTKVVREKYTIYGYNEKNALVSICLGQEEGPCGTQWCVSTYGCMSVNTVTHLPSFSYIPKQVNKLVISFDEDDENISCEAFDYSADGGDAWYPCGYFSINFDVFKETARHCDKRVVYVMQGPSGAGKSHLSGFLHGSMDVFETDNHEKLPECIYADVVVIGNKYKHGLDDIKPLLFSDPKISLVTFS